MSVKMRKIGMGRVYALTVLGGLLFALFIEPASAGLRELIEDNLDSGMVQSLAPLEPWFSRGVFGLFLASFATYLLWKGLIKAYSKAMMKNVVNLMRDRKLLSYKYKAPVSDSLKDHQDNVFSVLEYYVDTFAEVARDKKRYKEAVDVYADPTVAEGMERRKDREMLSSQRRQVAVLFSDIRGFTSMSERLKPEQVVAVLNDYFRVSAEAISANYGKINKFIGDAVMATFEDRAHADKGHSACINAVKAGMAMAEGYHKMVPVWQDRIAAEISDGIGVGITYGPAVMGNLGSKERLEYTAIGDTVNYSARLCGLAAGREVRISAEVCQEVKDYFHLRECEPVPIKGKTGMFVTYSVTGSKGF